MSPPGQMTGHYDSAHHHHEKSCGNEHQADFFKSITIGHGRFSKSGFEVSERPAAVIAGGRLIG